MGNEGRGGLVRVRGGGYEGVKLQPFSAVTRLSELHTFFQR
ncbi:unnamed protein product [Ectocarpus sp. 6 AP-2014]